MQSKDLILTLFGAVLWSTAPIVHKYLLGSYDQFTIMFLIAALYLVCLVLFLPYFYKELYKDVVKLTLVDSLLILFSGIFILFLGNIIYYYVLNNNNSHIIAALNSCAPFFTLLLAYFLLHEKVTMFGILGTVFIVLGVICISYNDIDISIYEMFLSRR